MSENPERSADPVSVPEGQAGVDETRQWRLVTGLGLLLLLPFIVRPPHIDDHLFLLVAQQIREAPLDPFGTGVNWFGWGQPLPDAQMNPPGISYVFAVAELVGGLPGLHLSVFAITALLLVGARRLALDLGVAPTLVTAGALITPAVFISATTLMCDIPMTAAFVWATIFWLRGLREDNSGWLAVGGLLACLAFVMKYFGLALVPLFAWAAIVHRKPLRLWLLPVLILPAFVVTYELAMAAQYGAPHFLKASAYASEMRRATEGLTAMIGDFGYLGGSMLGLALWAPFIIGRRGAALVVMVTAMVGLLIWDAGQYTWLHLRSADQTFRWDFYVQALIQTAAMAAILCSVGLAIHRRWREPATLVLVAWIVGTAFFAIGVNWTLAVRSVLPLVFPVAVLLSRELSTGRGNRRLHLLALVPGGVFTFLGANGDMKMANAQVEVASYALTLAPPERLWFRGHWGFQTAMERGGASPLDVDESPVRAGDIIVWPHINTGTTPDLSPDLVSPLPGFEAPLNTWFTTLQGGGFYSIETGPWPILVRDVPPLKLKVFKVVRGRVD